MASRRSDSNRTTPASARTPASTPTQVTSATPTRAAVSAPPQAAGVTPAQTPAKSPVKSPSRAVSGRTPQAKAAPAPHSVVSDDVRRAMIAEAAYFHAERRNFVPGAEVEDWLAAEAEVDALLRAGGGTRQ